jgi:RES domain-containing protein
MILHRIALAKYAATPADAFSGRGGLLGKGRWHTPGRPIVYLAEHISLAMAESLVHLQRSNMIAPYSRWEIEVPDKLIAPTPTLRHGWQQDPAYTYTQELGNAWLAAGKSVALLVPNAIVTEEFNCLLNPAHPAFTLTWVRSGPHPFSFDPRLTKP